MATYTALLRVSPEDHAWLLKNFGEPGKPGGKALSNLRKVCEAAIKDGWHPQPV